MSKQEVFDDRNGKELSIDLFEIVEFNLFSSLRDLKPEELREQASPEINNIFWIVGHCATHMDLVFCQQCQGIQIFSDEEMRYFGYGAKKEDILKEAPLSYIDLIDKFLEISVKTKEYLANLPEEDFRLPPKFPSKYQMESVFSSIQRVALHAMGHMGQIILIRRLIGNPGKSFVAGIAREQRKQDINNLKNWWKENKGKYQ